MMHFQQICEFLQQQNWAYQANLQEQQLQLQREGLTVFISLEDDGEFVKIVLPQVLILNSDHPHYELGLQCLRDIGGRYKLVRWQRDPRDGEVRLQADLPLEDGELSSRQFWRTLQGCLQMAQHGRKQVQQVLQQGAASGGTTRTMGMNLEVDPQAGEQMAFLSMLFKKILECRGAAEQIYPLLREHLSLLNADLIPALQQSWQIQQRQHPEQSQDLLPALFVTFGNLIQQFPLGNRAVNVEIAIACYDCALTIWTRETAPLQWAMTQTNLGSAYLQMPKGDLAGNLQQAIACYEAALTVRTPETTPLDWAMTQNNLGVAYLEMPTGDRARNLQQAINCYNNALRFRTPETAPLDWAMTQIGLGIAYLEMPTGDRAANLQEAISCCEAALTVLTPETAPLQWATTQTNLGNVYQKLPTGDRAANLQQAINCYNAALTVRTPETAPLDWAATQTNLGDVYQKLPTGDRAANLQQAINCCEAALTILTPETAPLDWATIQHKLGNAYLQLPTGDRAANLKQAIACYNAALHFRTPETAPLDWAMTQIGLGIAYKNLPTGDRTANLDRAIACSEAALTVLTRETAPLDWAMTQANLGIAYLEMPTGDHVANLKQTIACCDAALTVWTRKTSPLDWAMTQNNLGIAYSNLPTGDRAANLEEAINYYNAALTVWTRKTSPLDWATIQNNLGSAYLQLPKGDLAANLQQAISCYHKALAVRTRETAPLDWATTQNNLGSAYLQLPKGDRAANLQQAINCYHAALTVRTREMAPLDWATTQNNLGNAYSDLPTGDRAANLEQAITCFKAALTVRTPQLFPLDCLQTARNWGNLEFREGQWHNALTQYQTAIEAIEQSRRFALSEERRQQIVKESIDVYENAIQAAINLQDITSALEIVERVRAKRLVDLMATADLYQDGAIPAAVQDWLHQLDQLDQEIAQRRQNVASTSTETPEAPTSPQDTPNPPPETPEDDASPGDSPKHRHGVSRQLRAAMTATEEIRELEQQKQAILDQLSNLDDVVARLREVQPPKLQDFQPLLSENTALVSFYSTRNDTHLLILRSGESQPACFTCPGQGLETLQLWLGETWAALYLLDKTQWLAQMPATLQELAQRLRLNDLIEEHLQGIEELVLVPHLFLHQIPFAALPLKDGYLGDRFRLRYAPSLQVLGFCHGRQAVQTREYGTVENATDDLPFSSFEGMTVAHLFEIESQRRLIGAQAKTTAYRGLLEASNYLVSSHHAQSRWDNPLESGLRLSDGTITVSQLFSPAWRFPQLEEVYLSCCETGLFLPDSTLDEPVAVSTGFLCAGARGVIASQWSIYDLSAALLSGLYHRQRHGGLSRVAALQRAQQEMRQMTGKTFQQAYAKPLKTYLKSEQRRLQQDGEAVHRLKNGERLIKRYCHEAHPFEHPVHWAGLGCYGLG